MKLEFNKTNIILIVAFLLLVFVGLYLNDKTKETNEKGSKENILLVDDHTEFFSISNAGNKFIATLQKKDVSNLMLLLNESYVSNHNITKNNVLTHLKPFEEGIYYFEAKKMYYEDLNSNLRRYYIFGKIDKETIDDNVFYKDYYLIIDLDRENSLFAVTPYNGDIFKEGI